VRVVTLSTVWNFLNFLMHDQGVNFRIWLMNVRMFNTLEKCLTTRLEKCVSKTAQKEVDVLFDNSQCNMSPNRVALSA